MLLWQGSNDICSRWFLILCYIDASDWLCGLGYERWRSKFLRIKRYITETWFSSWTYVAATTFAIEVFAPCVVQYRAKPMIHCLNRIRWVVLLFRWAVVLVLMILKMELKMRCTKAYLSEPLFQALGGCCNWIVCCWPGMMLYKQWNNNE